MSVVNKVIVMARLDSGDDVKVSVKKKDGDLVLDDKDKLFERIKHSIIPLENVLYYTVRSDIHKQKNNWRVNSTDKLVDVVVDIFSNYI